MQEIKMYLTKEEKEQIRAAAQQEGRSMNNFIKWVLSNYLKSDRR